MVVILKPTLKCNIKCSHCYVGENAASNMSVEQLNYVLKNIPQNSDVVIHGGEPLLMGVDYYESLKNFSHRYSIQTNLTLFTEKWVEVFNSVFNGRISSSFDYPSERGLRPINSATWLKTVKFLKSRGIKPYVVSMFWKENENFPVDIYRFFKSLNLSFRLNCLIPAGRARNDFQKLVHTEGAYAEALIKIGKIWLLSKTKILVDPVMEILEAFILGNSLAKCPFTSKCVIHFISINPAGDVIPCGGFEEFHLTYGNIFTDKWEDIMNHPNRKKALERVLSCPSQCESCEWLHICGGGCRLASLSYSGNMFNRSPLCGELKRVFSFVSNMIDKNYRVINDWYLELMEERGNGI